MHAVLHTDFQESLQNKKKSQSEKKGGTKAAYNERFFCPQGHTLPGGVYLFHNKYSHMKTKFSREKHH